MKKTLPFAVISLLFVLSSCGSTDPTESSIVSDSSNEVSSQVTPTPSSEEPTPSSSEPTPSSSSPASSEEPVPSSSGGTSSDELKEFTGVSFVSSSYTYDGEEHTLEVTGAPEGTDIEYSNAGPYKSVGKYTISATLSKDGYRTTTLTATLTITKATFGDAISLNGAAVYYDGDDHIYDVQLVGSIPENTTVTYVWKNSSGTAVTEAIDIGTYSVSATLQNPNYEMTTLSATLTILASTDALPIHTKDGVIYFANGLDNGNLYRYDSSLADPVDYVSFLQPKDFFWHDEELALYAGATFTGGVYTVDDDDVDSLLGWGCYQSVISDGTCLYYAQNYLTNDQSGIYKVDLSGDEVVETQLYSGKAYYLQYSGGYIYFADGRNDKKLSKISASLTEATSSATLLADSSYDEGLKIKSLTEEDGVLYFNVNNLLGDWIGKYTISSGDFKKLTSTQGEYLTPIGKYLYFSNNDLLTTAISGHGIFRVPLAGGSIEQVVDDEYGINYLTYDEDGGYLVYTRTSDLHLIRYSISSKTSVDLLDGFEAPDPTPLNLGGKTVVHGDYVYYLDMYEGKCLARYKDGQKQLLTSNKVVDFSIIGDDIYFNQVNHLVNNDLFMADLTTSAPAERISTNDLNDIISDGEYLYAAKQNESGVNTALVRLGLDGSNPVEFFSKGADSLRIHDGSLFFLEDGELQSLPLSDIKEATADDESLTATVYDDAKHIEKFEFYGEKIVYSYCYGLTQALRIGSLTSLDNHIDLASGSTDPVDFVLDEDSGVAYYYNDVATNTKDGFWKVSLSATEDGTAECLYSTYGTDFSGNSLALSGSTIYFLNRGEGVTGTLYGDSHLYSLSLLNLSAGPTLCA